MKTQNIKEAEQAVVRRITAGIFSSWGSLQDS